MERLMNTTREARAIWTAVLISGAGCGAGIVGSPESDPAEPDVDDDAVSAMSEESQPMQANFGDPLPHLRQAELDRFDAGQQHFAEDEGVADGLGPVFNDTAWVRCHNVAAISGGSTTLVTRFGAVDGGTFDPLTQFGGSLIQSKGIGDAGSCTFVGETVPAAANVVAHRRTVPLFGLGLVDSVPESTFRFVAHVESMLFPTEAGRVAVVYDISLGRNAVGRFGWKNQETSLHQFSGDAYLNEMGITNPEFPDEKCPNGDCSVLVCNPRPDLNDNGEDVAAFTDFMTLLAPPPRTRLGQQATAGKKLFTSIGCTNCHWATFRTGSAPIGALSHANFHPYSDFLLHDMGSLGDGIQLGDAKGGEFRTAPLWGLSAATEYLHDGRAATIPDAILAHDGQADTARNRFAKLSPQDQAAIVAFLSSL
jgi:CxxC motif-containing protein (DUF1111 family)